MEHVQLWQDAGVAVDTIRLTHTEMARLASPLPLRDSRILEAAKIVPEIILILSH